MDCGEAVEWGGEIYIAVDFTSAGAPIGPTLVEMQEYTEDCERDRPWARAKSAVRVAYAGREFEFVDRIQKIGAGMSRDVFVAEILVEGVDLCLAVELPRRGSATVSFEARKQELRLLKTLTGLVLPFRLPRPIALLPGEPCEYGQCGERVVTSFGRGFIPLIRYRTKSLVMKVPHTNCSCGRTGDIYEGGILGRVDDMKLIRGTNVYPRAVEAILREYPEIEEFQIVLTRVDNIKDEITVQIELEPGYADDEWPELQKKIGKDLADNHEGLRFNVDRAAEGELPRFELKAKRLQDLRNQ